MNCVLDSKLIRTKMRPTKHASTLLECANKLYMDGQLCDTVLKVDRKQIYVHRLVLTAFSAYFEALIQANPGRIVNFVLTLRV